MMQTISFGRVMVWNNNVTQTTTHGVLFILDDVLCVLLLFVLHLVTRTSARILTRL